MAGSEGLFERPSDLRYLRPLPGWFLYPEHSTHSIFQASRSSVVESAYLVVAEWRPRHESLAAFKDAVQELVRHAHSCSKMVRSFLALQYLDEYQDESITIISIHKSKEDSSQWWKMSDIVESRYVAK